MRAGTKSWAMIQLRFSRGSKRRAVLLTIALWLTTAKAADSRKPSFPDLSVTRGRTAAGHAYQSGGISIDEQRAMERASNAYNLKLVFARGTGVLAPAEFVVIGANHDRAAEKIAVGAPWFYIRLPPGTYTVLARFGGRIVLIRDIYLQEGHLHVYRVRAD
jgi:hypothetical protein